MEVLSGYDKPCVCHGQGIPAAANILKWNKISVSLFADGVKQALIHGCSKGNNLLLVGATTSGKSWIIRPLTEIFTAFPTPAKESNHPLQMLDLYEIIVWHDYRVDENKLGWSELLRLFEGKDPLTICKPKPQAGSDSVYLVKQPCFMTSIAPLQHPKFDQAETDMMDSRWNVITLVHTIPKCNRVSVPDCGHCFRRFILEEGDSIPVPAAGAPCCAPFCSTTGLKHSAETCLKCGLPVDRVSRPFCSATGLAH